MSVWAEIWTRPGDASYGRVLDDVPATVQGLHDGVNQFGDGNMTLPDTFDVDSILFTDHLTPANSVSSTVKLFDDSDPTTPIFEWLPTSIFPTGSKDDHLIEVAGDGIKSIVDYGRVDAFDWDGSDDFVPADPDWQFGSGVNLLQDPSFDDTSFPNGGFEDGNANYWTTPEGGSIRAIEDPIQAQAGNFYGLFNPSGSGSIVRRQVQNLKLGDTYTITGWLDDLDGTGDRWRFGVNGASNATHTNAYEVDGIWYAELGNAPMGSGSSTGAYQQTTVTFVAEENPIEFFVEYLDVNDHNSAIDSFVLSGASLGVSNWTFGTGRATMNIAEVSTEQAHSGSTSLKLQGSDPAYIDPFGRIDYIGIRAQQTDVALTVGKLYTSSVWVYQTGAGNEDFTMWADRTAPQGPLAETVNGGFLPAPGSYWMASNTVSVPPNVWTKLQWTSIADTSGVNVGIAWNGGKTDVGTQSSPTFYVDDYELYEGLPATNAGEILRLLYEQMTDTDLYTTIFWNDEANPGTPYLTLDFTDTVDSAGVPWFETEISMRIWMRMTLKNVLDTLSSDYGIEWRVVPNDVEAGTYLLQVYNPGTMRVDYTSAASPAIQGGSSDVRRLIVRLLPKTDLMVEGLGRLTGRDRDPDLIGALGGIASSRIDRELPELTSVALAAYEDRLNALTDGLTFVYSLVDPQDTPLVDYGLGDLLVVHDPPEVDVDARLVDVTASLTPEMEEWEVQFVPATAQGS